METLKLGFDLGRRAQAWPSEFNWLFKYRDGNIHFEEVFRDAYEAEHPVVPGSTWERAAYSVESASRAVDLALDVLKTCVQSPVPTNGELADIYPRFGALVTKYEQVRPS